MKHDPRYAQWLAVANELEGLHSFLYDSGGSWAGAKNTYHEVTALLRSAQWIRQRCAKGRWYWWDKGWIAGAALEPLRSLYRVLNEGAWEGTEAGREVIARMERLQSQIAALSK